jgi:hypothetical protein
MRIRKKRMRPRRVLRGAKLEGAAIRELSDLSSWKDLPLTWAALAQRLGVSRQAIATKSAVQLAYNEAHKRLKAASEDQYSPEAIARRTSEERIASLEVEIKELRSQRDRWIERWAWIEHNAHQYGYDPDKLFEPLQPTPRNILHIEVDGRRGR